MSKLEIKTFTTVTPELLDILVTFENQIFDKPFGRDRLEKEASAKSGLLALVAYQDGKLCGYKAGYEHTTKRFYSWLGGVSPEFRGQGVAKELMVLQHKLLKEKGYVTVRTHTNNQFRSMLIFNIKFGFDIVGTMKGINDDELVIMLEKNL